MKRNQLILLVVLGALIGGAGLVFYKRENDAWTGSDARMGQKLIKNFPLNDVAHVVIREGTNELNLAKKGDQWVVQERSGYPANFGEISQLLRKVWELKIAQPQNISAAQLPRFELAAGAGTNSPTRLEFRGADGKPLQILLLGKKHMRQSQGDPSFGGGAFPDGRYVMLGDDVKTAALVTEVFTEAAPKADQWLDKEFLKVEKPKSITVTATNATNNWSVTRESESGDWKFADPKGTGELDKGKVSGLGAILASPSFNDIAPPERKPEELGLTNPRVATIETFDHFVYKVKIGNTNDEGNYFVQVDVASNPPAQRTPAADEKPEDKDRLDKEFKDQQTKNQEKLAKEEKFEPWIYVISKWTIDPLLKERHELLAEKKEETAPPPSAATPTTTGAPPIPAPAPDGAGNPVPFSPLKPVDDTTPLPKTPPPPAAPKVDIKPPPLPADKEAPKPPAPKPAAATNETPKPKPAD